MVSAPVRFAVRMSVTVRMISPQLYLVAWSGGGEPTAAEPTESEELLRLATSRRAGAHVLITASDASPWPRALEVLTEGTPALAATIEMADEERALRFHAPRGRGRVFELLPLDASRLDAVVAEIRSREGMRILERAFDDSLAAKAAQLRPRFNGPDEGHEGKRATTHAEAGHCEPDTLHPADRANARAYAHEAEGAIAFARRGAEDDTRVGLLIRGRESFELRPRADGKPLTGFSLVIARFTAPEDRGVVLRVELDQEDLGPWRLGQSGRDGQSSHDFFTIASDLMAGRSSFRLAFTPATDAPIATFDWGFHVEREIEGTWLFELEPSSVLVHGVATSADAKISRINTFTPSTGRCQRGLEMAAGTRAEYAVPSGYTRFTAAPVIPGFVTQAPDATLSIELDGKVATTLKFETQRTARVDLPIGGTRTLALAFDAISPKERLALMVPALLR